MATLTLGAQSGHPWAVFPQHIQQIMGPSPQPQAQPHSQHHATVSTATYFQPPILRPRNDVDLNRERLITLLSHFSQLLAVPFGNRPFRLVVHGGACMLLHPMIYQLSLEQHQYLPDLPHRTTTRDVDYIHRSFITEMAQLGIPNAAAKLQECILATARQFNLGADWMNSDADIALPMATAPNNVNYDPIYSAAVQPNNIDLHTIYRSPNGILTLISVTPFWAVSLKLVRYSPQDSADICLLLRNGTILSGTKWSFDTLREWLFANCWPMGYSGYDHTRLRKLNQRLEHAIQMMAQWEENAKAQPYGRNMAESAWSSVNVAFTPPANLHVSPLAAMGAGGEIVGGEHGHGGWRATWPNGGTGFHSHNNSPRDGTGSSPPREMDRRGDEKVDLDGFYNVAQFRDPADFSVVSRHAEDAAAAARKAKKKALKANRKSISAGQSSEPPPSYHTLPSYNSRPSSPWHLQPGQAPEQHGPGLSSFQDLNQSLGQMLHSQYAQPQPPQPAFGFMATQVAPYDPSGGGASWRAPEKHKKSKEKRKREKEKERERHRDRQRERISKWLEPREHHPPEDEYESGSETEEDEDDDGGGGGDSEREYRRQQRLSEPEVPASWMIKPPAQYPQQHQSQPYASGSSPHSRSQSQPQVPPVPIGHSEYLPPIPPPQHQPSREKSKSGVLDMSSSNHRSQGSLPPAPSSTFMSTYPGMQIPGGQAPARLGPHATMPVPLSMPPPPAGGQKKPAVSTSFYDSKSHHHHHHQQEEVFVPPSPGALTQSSSSQLQQQQQQHSQMNYQHHPESQFQAPYPYQYQHQHHQQQHRQPSHRTSNPAPNNSYGLY